jgi:hypothetical protein
MWTSHSQTPRLKCITERALKNKGKKYTQPPNNSTEIIDIEILFHVTGIGWQCGTAEMNRTVNHGRENHSSTRVNMVKEEDYTLDTVQWRTSPKTVFDKDVPFILKIGW